MGLLVINAQVRIHLILLEVMILQLLNTVQHEVCITQIEVHILQLMFGTAVLGVPCSTPTDSDIRSKHCAVHPLNSVMVVRNSLFLVELHINR